MCRPKNLQLAIMYSVFGCSNVHNTVQVDLPLNNNLFSLLPHKAARSFSSAESVNWNNFISSVGTLIFICLPAFVSVMTSFFPSDFIKVSPYRV